MSLEERINTMSNRARMNNHRLEKVELDPVNFEAILKEMGDFFKLRTEETLTKHCSSCKCKPHFFLATMGGMVKIEKSDFNCAYVLK